MPTRSRTSFKKRQKEIARMEKQRDKAAERVRRKLLREEGPPAGTLDENGELLIPLDENGEPINPLDENGETPNPTDETTGAPE
jgi:hypothetical protein